MDQYNADTFLLEKTFRIAIEMDEREGMRKNAFDLGSILGGVGNSIMVCRKGHPNAVC